MRLQSEAEKNADVLGRSKELTLSTTGLVSGGGLGSAKSKVNFGSSLSSGGLSVPPSPYGRGGLSGGFSPQLGVR